MKILKSWYARIFLCHHNHLIKAFISHHWGPISNPTHSHHCPTLSISPSKVTGIVNFRHTQQECHDHKCGTGILPVDMGFCKSPEGSIEGSPWHCRPGSGLTIIGGDGSRWYVHLHVWKEVLECSIIVWSIEHISILLNNIAELPRWHYHLAAMVDTVYSRISACLRSGTRRDTKFTSIHKVRFSISPLALFEPGVVTIFMTLGL